MNFKDILNMERGKTEVFFGYNDDKAEKIDLKNCPSVIITGSTGTSKSVMLHQILLQLIKNNNPDELKIVSINPTKVELKPYLFTKYSYNKDISLKCDDFNSIINIIQNRINLFCENSVNDFDEYNKLQTKDLPIIVIAIDEATFLLNEENSEEKLKWIIEKCKSTGIILLLTTNDIYSKFFDKGYNTLANIRISFDFVSNEDSKQTNLLNCDKLKLDEFLMEINNDVSQKKYKTFYFEDNIIDDILKKEETI